MSPSMPLDGAQFVQKGVSTLTAALQRCLKQHDRCVVGLSGGKTPIDIYRQLGQEKVIDWNRVHVFLVDERYVPPQDAESNQALIRSTLLAHASIPEDNLSFPRTTLPLEACVAEYDARLKALLTQPADIVTLGIGGDGHTASLFPPLPEEAFGPQYVIQTHTTAFAVHHRISVTLPILTSARERILLLKGRDKLEAWQEMTVDSADERFWPLKAVCDTGEVTVIMGE